MECGWATLQRQIQRAESLDGVVEAHHQFLDTLIARFPSSLSCSNYVDVATIDSNHRALLDERSRELLTQLRAIYDRFLTLRQKLLRIFPQDSGVPNCGRQDPPGGRGGVGREAGWSRPSNLLKFHVLLVSSNCLLLELIKLICS